MNIVNIINKIGRGFFKFIFGMIITAFVLTLTSSPEQGGVNLNGFLAFLIWAGLMFLLIKYSTILSLAICFTLYFIAIYITQGMSDSFLYSLMSCAILIILMISCQHEKIIRGRIKDNHSKGLNCCPRCASTRIHYVQGHTEVSSNIEWNYDYIDGRRHRDNVISSKFREGYWKCDNCGKIFKS